MRINKPRTVRAQHVKDLIIYMLKILKTPTPQPVSARELQVELGSQAEGESSAADAPQPNNQPQKTETSTRETLASEARESVRFRGAGPGLMEASVWIAPWMGRPPTDLMLHEASRQTNQALAQKDTSLWCLRGTVNKLGPRHVPDDYS